MAKAMAILVIGAAALAALGGCDKRGSPAADTGVRQTGFPGQISAGGGTSGEVMERTARSLKGAGVAGGTPGIPQGAGGNTGGAAMGGVTGTPPGQEGVRGQAPGGTGVAGTPGIPEGAGGTPSGAELGGTTSGAAGSKVAPEPGGAPPSLPPPDSKK